MLAKLPAPLGEQLSKPKLDIPKLGLGNEEKFNLYITFLDSRPPCREAGIRGNDISVGNASFNNF